MPTDERIQISELPELDPLDFDSENLLIVRKTSNNVDYKFKVSSLRNLISNVVIGSGGSGSVIIDDLVDLIVPQVESNFEAFLEEQLIDSLQSSEVLEIVNNAIKEVTSALEIDERKDIVAIVNGIFENAQNSRELDRALDIVNKKVFSIAESFIPRLERDLAKVNEDLENLNSADLINLQSDLDTLTGELSTLNTVTLTGIVSDITALNEALEGIGEVDLSGVESDLQDLSDKIDILNDTTIPDVNTTLSGLNDDLTALDDKFPLATEDLADGIITNAKIGLKAILAGSLADGTITSAQMGPNSVLGGILADNAVSVSKIVDGAITALKLGNGSVTSDKIGTGAVSNNKIIDGAITELKLGNLAVTNAKIGANAVTGGNILGGTITGNKIAGETITGTLIAANTIVGGNILSGSVNANRLEASTITAGLLASDAIIARHILAGEITGDKIAASTITGGKIVANSIDGDRITTNTLNASKIVASSIGSDKIAANTITAGNIAANAIGVSELSANSVNASKIVAGSITTDEIAANTIEAGNIKANTITGSEILAGSVGADRIVANSITTTQLSAGNINGNVITANTINGDRVIANTISGNRIVAGSLGADRIVANSITSGQISSNAITTNELASNSVTAVNILAGNVTAGKLSANSVVAGNIQAGQITATKMAVDAIETDAIKAGAIVVDKLASDSISAIKIQSDAITSDKILAGAVTAIKILSGSITTAKLDASAVTADKIDVGSLTGVILTGTILRTKASGNNRVVIGDTTFPLWFGDGTVGTSGGKFYVTNGGVIVAKNIAISGDSVFSGEVRVANVGVSVNISGLAASEYALEVAQTEGAVRDVVFGVRSDGTGVLNGSILNAGSVVGEAISQSAIDFIRESLGLPLPATGGARDQTFTWSQSSSGQVAIIQDFVHGPNPVSISANLRATKSTVDATSTSARSVTATLEAKLDGTTNWVTVTSPTTFVATEVFLESNDPEDEFSNTDGGAWVASLNVTITAPNNYNPADGDYDFRISLSNVGSKFNTGSTSTLLVREEGTGGATSTGDASNATITVNGTGALSGGGSFTLNQTNNATVSVTHGSSAKTGAYSGTGLSVLQSIGHDNFGHVKDFATINLATEFNKYLLVNGNAATTTKLNTARAINGVSFDGTANITIADSTKLPTGAKAADSNLLDGINSSQFVRSDTGTIPVARVPTLNQNTTGTAANANTLGNRAFAESATADKIVSRDGAADIQARLFRSNYQDQTGISSNASLAFRNSTSDNYIRFVNNASSVRSWLDSDNANNLTSGTISDAILPATISSNITGNAATVTNGVYTSGDQTIGGAKTFSSPITISTSGDGKQDILKVGVGGIFKYSGQGSLAFTSDSSCMLFAGDSPEGLLTGLGYYENSSHTEDAIIGADFTVRLISGMQGGYAGSSQATFNNSGEFRAPSLYATGNITAAGTVFGNQITWTSALKYKNIEETRVSSSESLDLVYKIGKRGTALGTLKSDKTNKKHRWFIADEVIEDMEEVVHVKDGEVEGIQYNEMIPDVYGAIAALKEIVDSQAKQILELTKRLDNDYL